MSTEDFARYAELLHKLTVDFVRAVPEDRRDYTPDPPGPPGRVLAPHRIGEGFAPFCKQVRHVVCVHGVYNAALRKGKVDWTGKHDHYRGSLAREPLLAGLEEKHRELLATLEGVDTARPIDWDGTPFTFAQFTWEFIHHEAIHHGQWSVYASLGEFATPISWRTSWGL